MGLAITQITGNEPVRLAEAKMQLRIDAGQTAEDLAIAVRISTARQWCERATSRSLITKKYRWTLDHWPVGLFGYNHLALPLIYPTWAPVRLPLAPVQSVDSVTYYDVNGTVQDLTASIIISINGDVARITPLIGSVWPVTQINRVDAVTIDFTAGYPGDVIPEQIKQAMLLLISHFDQHRGDDAMELPPALNFLLCAYRWSL